MKGKITKYFEDKGYGFIIDTDGNNRFFHISDVKSTEPIINYSEVEFQPSSNNKGLSASEIYITPNKKPQFINFGDVRIKLNNIKNYGITSETEKYEETIILEKNRLEKTLSNTQNTLTVISHVTNWFLGADILPNAGISGDKTEVIVHKTNYNVLYITTYQGDNYRFSEKNASFNIKEKLTELDKYLT